MHEILAKALNILPKREHIELVKKFAQLEFQKGDPEQGRSLFEGLVADVSKELIYGMYIDQEIKQDNKTSDEDDTDIKSKWKIYLKEYYPKITRKQAKFFFNKWLNYEEDKQDENMIARVKSKAAEYVQNNS